VKLAAQVDLALHPIRELEMQHVGAHVTDCPYFKTNQKLFPAIGFLVDLLQHLPDAGAHLIPWASALRSSARARRYGLYSSRSRGTWSRKPYLVRLAPEGWKEQHALQSASDLGRRREQDPRLSVSQKETRSA
jgi:hypothetical protein